MSGFTINDLRDAFKAGWKERNRSPGLKRKVKRSLNNALLNAMGGGRYADVEYVPDTRSYHQSIWQNSEFRASAIEAATAGETRSGSTEGESAAPQEDAQ